MSHDVIWWRYGENTRKFAWSSRMCLKYESLLGQCGFFIKIFNTCLLYLTLLFRRHEHKKQAKKRDESTEISVWIQLLIFTSAYKFYFRVLEGNGSFQTINVGRRWFHVKAEWTLSRVEFTMRRDDGGRQRFVGSFSHAVCVSSVFHVIAVKSPKRLFVLSRPQWDQYEQCDVMGGKALNFSWTCRRQIEVQWNRFLMYTHNIRAAVLVRPAGAFLLNYANWIAHLSILCTTKHNPFSWWNWISNHWHFCQAHKTLHLNLAWFWSFFFEH